MRIFDHIFLFFKEAYNSFLYDREFRIYYGAFMALILISMVFGFYIGGFFGDCPADYFCIPKAIKSNETFFFTEEVSNKLDHIWNESVSLKKEIGFCMNLNGNIFDNITDVRLGGIDSVSMSGTNCKYAAAHTHPNGGCVQSYQDAIFINRYHEKYGTNYSIIMCGRGDIAVYDHDSFSKSAKTVMMH